MRFSNTFVCFPNYIRRDTWTSQMLQMPESKTSRDYLMRTSAFFLGSINSWNISQAQRKSAFLIQKHFKKKGILSSFYLSGPRILKNWEYIVKPIYAAYCSVSTAYPIVFKRSRLSMCQYINCEWRFSIILFSATTLHCGIFILLVSPFILNSVHLIWVLPLSPPQRFLLALRRVWEKTETGREKWNRKNRGARGGGGWGGGGR